MSDPSFWFAVYMFWFSAAAVAWPIYARSAWEGWIEAGGGRARFWHDAKRFTLWMLGGDLGDDSYEPGQKLRFGITLTLGSTSVIAAFYWQLSRTDWTVLQLATNLFVVALSYFGIMIHLYVAWRENRHLWRWLAWSQAVLFLAAWAVFPHTGLGAGL